MLRRAKRLRAFFEPFCNEYDCEEMLLNDQEWRQVEYLLQITRPFYVFTTELSKTTEVTTHLVFKLYNALFDHFFDAERQLRHKRVLWKKDMLAALEAGRLKLDEYYSQTDNLKGHIYAVGTMLAPDSRYQFFLQDNWEPHWRDTYRKSFRESLLPYQERLAACQQQPSDAPSTATSSSRLNKMLKSNVSVKPAGDEMSQYLDSGMLLYFFGSLYLMSD
jgi:hypothetical protein